MLQYMLITFFKNRKAGSFDHPLFVLKTFSAICDNKEMEDMTPHAAYLTHSAEPTFEVEF